MCDRIAGLSGCRRRSRDRQRQIHDCGTDSSDSGRNSGEGSEGTSELSTTLSSAGRYANQNVASLLRGLPESPKHLMSRLERQRDEMRVLQDENNRLRAREVEVSALVLRLQQQFHSTQQQVSTIKTQIHTHLSSPVTESEYDRLNALPEDQRDLLDTIKLGIFRQIGALKGSADAANRRAAELSATVQKLTDENSELKLRLAECTAVAEAEKETYAEKLARAERGRARVVELEKTVEHLESKLKSAYLDQEQFLASKLQSQCKTDEVARLGVRLEEAEMNAERYRATAECCEQKLDILKSEYYELKLRQCQRILELESCLKASEEKLKSFRDLEQESELYIMNVAAQIDCRGSGTATGAVTDGGTGTTTTTSLESWYALPQSRKIAHSLTVAKRCLQLENKLHVLQHDLEFKEKQITRLQVSLDAAREALHNVNSPYTLVERTLNELQESNDELTEKNRLLSEEVKVLQSTLEERLAEIKLLCGHRRELLRMKKLIQEFGVKEGLVELTREEEEKRRKKRLEEKYSKPNNKETKKSSASTSSSGPSSTTGTHEQQQQGQQQQKPLASSNFSMQAIEIQS